ncbi:MAG: dual specificity protein phosphatase family protein [Alphaproteobacteria bacterium]|nr:dual specificity protein phosphatase family protein [Alphaproteobacteria bacterium]
MLPFDITICAEAEVCDLAEGHTHILSITDPGFRAVIPRRIPEDRVLRLAFHDLDRPPPPDDPIRRALAAAGRAVVLPRADHVRHILSFGRDLPPGGRVLVHCMAGVSRSTAAAFMLGCQASPGRETRVLAHIRRLRPQAQPNRLMVTLADEALGAGGRMVAARESLPPPLR